MLQIGKNILSRIFVAWIFIMEELACKMRENIIKTSHCLTEIIIESTEFRLKQSSNYVLSTHSNIINTQSQRERQRERERQRDRERLGLILREIYPGSIFERNISENHEISETLLDELKKKKRNHLR